MESCGREEREYQSSERAGGNIVRPLEASIIIIIVAKARAAGYPKRKITLFGRATLAKWPPRCEMVLSPDAAGGSSEMTSGKNQLLFQKLFSAGSEQIKWKSWCDSNDSPILFSSLGGLGGLPGSAAAGALEARRRLFLRSHEQPSFQSDISAKTAASR